ncbi:TPA_asm: hypothetical protein, partial [Monosiga MELD virus 1]
HPHPSLSPAYPSVSPSPHTSSRNEQSWLSSMTFPTKATCCFALIRRIPRNYPRSALRRQKCLTTLLTRCALHKRRFPSFRACKMALLLMKMQVSCVKKNCWLVRKHTMMNFSSVKTFCERWSQQHVLLTLNPRTRTTPRTPCRQFRSRESWDQTRCYANGRAPTSSQVT